MVNLKHYLTRPWIIPLAFQNHRMGFLFPDKLFIQCRYKNVFGVWPDLKTPKSFNEKIQYLKLHDHNPWYTMFVDKYAVKQYVASIIGDQYIIPTIGVWDSYHEVDLKKLPNQFVLKCTHDSGGIVICKDKTKLDFDKALLNLKKSFHTDYYLTGREWPYKNVKRRIIAEKYLEDPETEELWDYKFFCFDGIARYFKIDFNRSFDHHSNYYDIDGNLLKVTEVASPPVFEKKITLPDNFQKMIEIAELLSKGFPFLRVDLYNINGCIYFGEMTFYPASGFGKYEPHQFDIEMGNCLVLPRSLKKL